MLSEEERREIKEAIELAVNAGALAGSVLRGRGDERELVVAIEGLDVAQKKLERIVERARASGAL